MPSSRYSRDTDAPSACSDVAARPPAEAGNWLGAVATLRPVPITTADPSGVCSARIPASLRPPTSTSLGHLSIASTHPVDRTADATATPVSSVSQPRRAAGTTAGRSRTEKVSDAPGSLDQDRPSLPRPAVCSSATSTCPSGLPGSATARASRSALVEPVLGTTSSADHMPCDGGRESPPPFGISITAFVPPSQCDAGADGR